MPRLYDGHTSLTILNGKRSEAVMTVARYAEVIGSHTTARDVITGNNVDISRDIKLAPREALILEF